MDGDVIIAGGGLNGPALALALQGAGLRVVLVDARRDEARGARGFDGRAYALAMASVRMLKALDIWPSLQALAQPIRQIKASDGRVGTGASPLFLHFDSAELDDGPMGQMVEDRHLFAAFRSALAARPGITVITGESVVSQEVDSAGMRVTLASGQILSARLLVGADGRGSGVCARAGIRRQGWDYGQTALVCAVNHARNHEGIAHQLFLPGGPLAILPLPGGHHSSIVWAEQAEVAGDIQALDDAGYLAALRPRFGDFLGEISLAGDRFAYPLSLSLAERFTAPRVALVGDAAHGVHPLAGQGLNLGLRDVAALAEVLAGAHRRGEDVGASGTLEAYQRWRRFDTVAMGLGMDAVNRLFSNDNPIVRLGRDLGMGVVTALPALRQRFMRQAAGVTGDLPRLLQGQPL